jgi:hypothetical protein
MISGKIVDQNLNELPNVIVMTLDSKVLDTTDFHGSFNFQFNPEIKKIKVRGLMYQEEEIELIESCNTLEIVLLEVWIYDFVTVKKAERKRIRDRKKILTKLYSEAYERKIFTNQNECRTKIDG